MFGSRKSDAERRVEERAKARAKARREIRRRRGPSALEVCFEWTAWALMGLCAVAVGACLVISAHQYAMMH